MMLVSEPETEPSNLSDNKAQQIPAQYKGWRLSTKLINGKLWLRWQHPKESFARFGCPINQDDIASTINHGRFLIDLAIKLEEETVKQRLKNQ